MGILQLLSIIFCLLFGFLTAYVAKLRGRMPLIGFCAGVLFGLIGLLVFYYLPKKENNKNSSLPSKLQVGSKLPIPSRSDAWLKFWYFLDPVHSPQGPFEFPDLVKHWQQQRLSEKTYVWGEGMKEWKRLGELPDLLKEMSLAN